MLHIKGCCCERSSADPCNDQFEFAAVHCMGRKHNATTDKPKRSLASWQKDDAARFHALHDGPETIVGCARSCGHMPSRDFGEVGARRRGLAPAGSVRIQPRGIRMVQACHA